MQSFLYEEKLKSLLDRVSNNEDVHVDDALIEEAGEAFKAALRRQFTPRDGDFRLRMSNIGKPLCQLQMEKAGAPASRRPYNHALRMMVGDAVECITTILIKAAGLPVTAEKTGVELSVGSHPVIKGEDDIHLDDKVYDIKSCSPWAFDNKWSEGWEGLMDEDGFGYRAQLTGYALAQRKEIGGWIVVNKSTGEIKVVSPTPSKDDLKAVVQDIRHKVEAIESDVPFERCFTDEEEFFRKKPTGNRRIPKACTFCDYLRTCWPEAQYRPQGGSAAKNPTHYWYSEYSEESIDSEQ